MGVSKNRGTPKSSILSGFSIINHPFWGTTILETLISFPFGYLVGSKKKRFLGFQHLDPQEAKHEEPPNKINTFHRENEHVPKNI